MVASLFLLAASSEVDPYLRVGATAVESRADVLDVDEDLDASSIAFESEVGLDIENGRDTLHFEIDADYVDFTNPDFTDRWRFRGEVAWTREWSEDFETRLRVDAGKNVPTASFFDTTLVRYRLRVQYEPVRAHRGRIEARWRTHDYDDDSGTGHGPRVDADYRHRIGRYHYIELESRWERIDAVDPYRAYERYGLKALYTRPITDDLRVRPALAYLATDFPGRGSDTGPFRQDRQWVPEVEFLWWPDDWRFSAEFQYRARASSDRNRDIEGARIELKAAYEF